MREDLFLFLLSRGVSIQKGFLSMHSGLEYDSSYRYSYNHLFFVLCFIY